MPTFSIGTVILPVFLVQGQRPLAVTVSLSREPALSCSGLRSVQSEPLFGGREGGDRVCMCVCKTERRETEVCVDLWSGIFNKSSLGIKLVAQVP